MNPWKIISDQEIEAIHEATLRVLSEVGIVLDHPQIREQLADCGATLSGNRVQIPPDLVESAPFPNSELGLEDSVIFYFNQAMEHSTVEAAFSGLSGRFSWIDDSTLVFTPETPLSPATQIDLGFDTQAQAVNGLSLVEPISLVFQSVGYLDLAQTVPEHGTKGVDPSAPIVASFNRPVVPLGAAPETLPAAFYI